MSRVSQSELVADVSTKLLFSSCCCCCSLFCKNVAREGKFSGLNSASELVTSSTESSACSSSSWLISFGVAIRIDTGAALAASGTSRAAMVALQV